MVDMDPSRSMDPDTGMRQDWENDPHVQNGVTPKRGSVWQGGRDAPTLMQRLAVLL